MNYYDELGLAPNAADEDIRKAHRTLSKLLHPDLQTDPAAREAAELQMRRINAIVSTLLDPRQRREYDASLRPEPFPAVFVPTPMRVSPWRRQFGGPVGALLLTVAAALVLTGAATWFLGGDLLHFEPAGGHPVAAPEHGAPATPQQPGPTTPAAVARPAAPAAGTNGRVAAPQRTVAEAGEPQQIPVSAPAAQPAPPAAQPPQGEQIARPGFTGLPDRVEPASGGNVPAEPPPQPAVPAPVVPIRQEAARVATTPGAALSGWWLYAPSGRKTGATTLYAPEYIQLQIRSAEGAVHGEYSARYRVPDRAISANVAFHFEGKADGAPSFEWQSDDGSRGVVELKMLTAESLQVNWRVSRFGTRMGLGAGTAVLIRKISP